MTIYKSNTDRVVVLRLDQLVDQLAGRDPLHQRREIEVLPLPAQVAHQDAVGTAALHRVVDIHQGQLQRLNELPHRHAAHVPPIGFTPDVPAVLDHVQVRRVPEARMCLLAQERLQIIQQQVEALVQVGTFETQPHLLSHLDRGAPANAGIERQAVLAPVVGRKKALDDVATAVAAVAAIAPGSTVRERQDRVRKFHDVLQLKGAHPLSGVMPR